MVLDIQIFEQKNLNTVLVMNIKIEYFLSESNILIWFCADEGLVSNFIVFEIRKILLSW